MDRTALYRFHDPDERLLYVGITRNPAKRFERHASEKSWWEHIARIDIEWHDTRAAALDAEREAIKTENPLHNVVHAVLCPRPSDVILTWPCDECGQEIVDKSGYLFVRWQEIHDEVQRERDLEERAHTQRGFLTDLDLREVLDSTGPARWHALHEACDTDRNEHCYTIRIETCRTMTELVRWTVHLLEKNWINATDWDRLLAAATRRADQPTTRSIRDITHSAQGRCPE